MVKDSRILEGMLGSIGDREMKLIKCKMNKIEIMIVIFVQIILCIFVGTQKKNFFCDEIYSYGLANSEKYSFIDPETAKGYSETGWVNQDYFKNYIQVSNDVSFSFNAAFENQRNDVHPPLYYCILHIFSLLNGKNFSKWTGLSFNFMMLIFIDILFLYISNYLLKNKRLSIIALLFWTFSGAGLSNILFIRMYMMLTCEMLAYVAIHIKFFEKRAISKKGILGLLFVVVCGGLTHYYFYLFVVCFSAPICIYLLFHKEIKKMFLYGMNISAGVGGALCIFPETLKHIFFGYRGTEVIGNLSQRRDKGIIDTYLKLMNNSMFGGKFQFCLGIVVLLIGIYFFTKYFMAIDLTYNKNTNIVNIHFAKKDKLHLSVLQFVFNNELILELLLILSYGLFAFVAMKGSFLLHNRYLYPIYPIISLFTIKIIHKLLDMFIGSEYIRDILISTVCIVLCVESILGYGIDFMYADYDKIYEQVQEIKGTDCLLYYGDGWLDVYTNFTLRFVHDETYFMRSNEIDNLQDILLRRNTKNNLTVCLPIGYSDEETKIILDKVIAQTSAHSYRQIYKYSFLQEWLIE